MRQRTRNKRQQEFPGFRPEVALSFGGARLKSHPKEKRPEVLSQPLHLVLRSSKAHGRYSLLLRDRALQRIAKRLGSKVGVNLRHFTNAGNHLHLIVQVEKRGALKKYLKALSGLIARQMTGAERGKPCHRKGIWTRDSRSEAPTLQDVPKNRPLRFWDARPFTRIVNWGKDYTQLKNYLMLNGLEVAGMNRLSARAMFARIERLTRECRLVPLGFA
jgi:REP element-mobilizing transposase RayT